MRQKIWRICWSCRSCYAQLKKRLYLRGGAFRPRTSLLSHGSVHQERGEEEGDPPVEVHPVSGSHRELSRISVVWPRLGRTLGVKTSLDQTASQTSDRLGWLRKRNWINEGRMKSLKDQKSHTLRHTQRATVSYTGVFMGQLHFRAIRDIWQHWSQFEILRNFEILRKNISFKPSKGLSLFIIYTNNCNLPSVNNLYSLIHCTV